MKYLFLLFFISSTCFSATIKIQVFDIKDRKKVLFEKITTKENYTTDDFRSELLPSVDIGDRTRFWIKLDKELTAQEQVKIQKESELNIKIQKKLTEILKAILEQGKGNITEMEAVLDWYQKEKVE